MKKFLAKPTLFNKKLVKFSEREVEFEPNRVFELSDDEAAFLKKKFSDVFEQLLELRLPKAIKKPEPVEALVCEELSKLLLDEPELEPEDLVEVELVVGEEPKPPKKYKSKKGYKKRKTVNFE